MCVWTIVILVCQSILDPQSYHSLLYITEQGMCPNPISSPSIFTLAFVWYENWKSAFF